MTTFTKSKRIADLEQQVAALTLELDEAGSNCSMYKQQVLSLTKARDAWRMLADHNLQALKQTTFKNAAAQAREAKLRKQLQRVIGCHNPPNDCYSTGPLTGNEFVDLVSCPSCEAEALLALPADDSALKAALKAERERICGLYSPDDTASDFMDKIRGLA